jgi:uncharacterized protein YvpB
VLQRGRRAFLKDLAAGAVAAGLAAVPSVARAAALPAATAVPAGVVPPVWYIPDNPIARDYRQEYNLSCEVAAFKIVLIHYGFGDVTEELLQDVLGVDENPNRGFRGDYRAMRTNGLQNYGAHAPALARIVGLFPVPGRFNAVRLAGLAQVQAALSRNWLALVWIPVGLEPSRRQMVTLSTGEQVSFVPGEHVIALHGYDQGGFYTYDPRPSPRVPGYVRADALGAGMSLFDLPGLAIQPLF